MKFNNINSYVFKQIIYKLTMEIIHVIKFSCANGIMVYKFQLNIILIVK